MIDFPEEGVEDIKLRDITDGIHRAVAETDRILASADTGRIYRDGLRTAIIGKPNVGKSSLLNYILGEERAIVTPVAGTTRDVIAEYYDLGGVPVRFVDTAGIRVTGDVVESIGVERSYEAIEGSALVLMLFDATRPVSEEDAATFEHIRRLCVPFKAILNKADAHAVTAPKQIEALTG